MSLPEISVAVSGIFQPTPSPSYDGNLLSVYAPVLRIQPFECQLSFKFYLNDFPVYIYIYFFTSEYH